MQRVLICTMGVAFCCGLRTWFKSWSRLDGGRMFDVLIRRGTVLEGTSTPTCRLMVGLAGGRITAFARCPATRGRCADAAEPAALRVSLAGAELTVLADGALTTEGRYAGRVLRS